MIEKPLKPAKKKPRRKKLKVKGPRGRPPTGKVRVAPMPSINPEHYNRLKMVARATKSSVATTCERAIDILHLQTFHM